MYVISINYLNMSVISINNNMLGICKLLSRTPTQAVNLAYTFYIDLG
jgi:hypothetical protein